VSALTEMSEEGPMGGGGAEPTPLEGGFMGKKSAEMQYQDSREHRGEG